MTRETRGGPTKSVKPLPRNEDPEFYEGLGRAIKVARTALGLERKELAELAGVSYAYLSDIETGRGRPGSRSFLAIADALGQSPSELMREAELYRARIVGKEVPVQNLAVPGSPESEVQSRMARLSEAAPSPAARRWFHAGRMLAAAEMDLASEAEEDVRSAGLIEEGGVSTSRVELHRMIDELPPEDFGVVLALVRRLRSAR